MNVEIQVIVNIAGKPLWMKKKSMGGEMTKLLTDKDYDQVVLAAEEKLASLINPAKEPIEPDENEEPEKTDKKNKSTFKRNRK